MRIGRLVRNGNNHSTIGRDRRAERSRSDEVLVRKAGRDHRALESLETRTRNTVCCSRRNAPRSCSALASRLPTISRSKSALVL